MTSTGTPAGGNPPPVNPLPGIHIIEEGHFPPGAGTQSGGFDWNPVSWFDSAASWTGHQVESTVVWGGTELVRVAGWAGGVIAGISKAVFHFVNVGLHVLENLTMRIVGILHKMIADLFTAVHKVEGLVNGAVDWIHHSATWLSGQLASFGQKINTDIVQPAIHAAVAGLHAAGHVATAAIAGVQHSITWIEHDVIKPMQTEIAHLEHGVTSAADAALSTFNTDVVQPVVGKVEHLTEEVASLATQIPGDLGTILSDVVQAADWIAWMALHSFTDIEGLFTSATTTTIREVTAPASEYQSIETQLDNMFKELLG